MQQAAAAALLVLIWVMLRLLQANALATTRNMIAWLVLGAGLSGALSLVVDTNSLVGLPLAGAVMLLWGAPAISLLTLKSHRLLTRMEHAMNRGELDKAETLLARAAAAVNDCSPVDVEWNRIQLGRLEGRLRMAQGRLGDALPALQESHLRARDLGVPLYVNETGEKLLECFRALDLHGDADELAAELRAMRKQPRWQRFTPVFQARRASDSGASVHALPADTTSPRSL